jgi:hypothetical protein
VSRVATASFSLSLVAQSGSLIGQMQVAENASLLDGKQRRSLGREAT